MTPNPFIEGRRKPCPVRGYFVGDTSTGYPASSHAGKPAISMENVFQPQIQAAGGIALAVIAGNMRGSSCSLPSLLRERRCL